MNTLTARTRRTPLLLALIAMVLVATLTAVISLNGLRENIFRTSVQTTTIGNSRPLDRIDFTPAQKVEWASTNRHISEACSHGRRPEKGFRWRCGDRHRRNA